MLRIHPLELVHVEHAGTLDDPIDIERFDQLVAGKDFVLSTIVPSQQRQIIDHSIGQEPIQPKLIARRGTMSLRQLLLVLPQNQRAVRVPRPRCAERIQYQSLTQRVRQVLLGSDHGGDPHRGVVHRDAKVVHGDAARTEQDEIADGRLGVPGDSAADGVVDDDAGTGGDLEADRVGIAGGDLLGHEFRVGVAPGSVVAWRDAFGLHSGLHLFQFFRSAEAWIGLALVDEGFAEFGVDGGAF
mmetsp:Transcript_31214/g.57869  ORF Transcript_31214/g.57869 Transcript_31214/m.57869 type:complete len:242 (-) Transcript_31214:947-1672(-)